MENQKMNEEFRKSPIFEWDYQVSNYGRVISNETGKEKKPFLDRNGYVKIHLYSGGKDKMVSVHRLVALAFVPNPFNYKEVNHIDGNKQNNTASNLEWCSRSHNISEAFRLGLKVNKKGSENVCSKTFYQFNKRTGELIRKWGSIAECAKYLAECEFPDSEAETIRINLGANLHNRIKTCCGYIFSFKEDIMPELKSHKWEMGQKGVIGVRRDLKGNVVERLRFESVRDVAMAGFDPSLVCKCLKGKRQSHKDFAWFYEDEYNKSEH